MNQKLVKRLLSLALCAAMTIGTLAGCGSAEKEEENAAAESEDSDAAEESDVAEAAEPEQISLEGEELTIWMPHFWTGQLSDHSENAAFQKVQEDLGIKLNFITPPIGQEQEQLNVMIASGEYPDIIVSWWTGDNMFVGGLDKYVEDGVFIDMTEYLEKYAPDYLAAIENYIPEEELNYFYTDAGRMVGIYGISPYQDSACNGPLIRGDWLEELDMEVPTTIQEYEDMLIAFKEEMGATAPYLLPEDGYDYQSGIFVTAYGIGPEFYQVDGEVKYGPIQPEYKEYLTLMNKWYEMGLIDKDFMSRDESAWIRMLLEGESGFTSWSPDSMSSYMGDAFEVIVGDYPVLNEGERVKYRQYVEALQVKCMYFPAYVTTACEKPEVAAAFLNYGYTEEGYMTYNYGIEGVHWNYSDETINCNGIELPLAEYTDEMLNNPDYPVMDAILQFKVHAGPFLRFENEGNPTIVAAGDVGVERRQQLTVNGDTDLCMPQTSMTMEEGDDYARIMGQVETYVDTAILEFIIGTRSLDEFDSYVEQVKKLEIDTATAYEQAALDRFYSRTENK